MASTDLEQLVLQGVVGFNGKVLGGHLIHPGDQHSIYTIGSTVVVKHITENTQTFLQKGGHDRDVSCLAISSSGKYLASGQVTHMGFTAVVKIWDLETYECVHTLSNHKGKVEAVAFSPDERFLATLGGRDDNNMVVWNVETGEAICGTPASTETALTLKWYNNRSDMLVSAGCYNLRVWKFDEQGRKLAYTDAKFSSLRRVFQSIAIDDNDEFLYCGTETGDIVQVSLNDEGANYNFKQSTPPKKFLSMGVKSLAMTANGALIAGAGDGTVAVINPANLLTVRKTKFAGSITSIALNAAQDHFFVGTDKGNIYLAELATLEKELRSTCHHGPIKDVAFPEAYSELFATCAANDIRVWHARTRNELLRIQVPNLECLCVTFSPDGKSLISGWSDGKVRAFKPQSGKLLYAINDAHRDGVTAIACQSSTRLITGGSAGQVRVWRISPESKTSTMIASMKEHKKTVNSICINADKTECVTASSDGSCIVWDLQRFVRNNVLFASTKFMAVLYHPDQSQLLTCGTDRKVTYWNAVGDSNDSDNSPIRITNASEHPVNTLDISEDGEAFVSSGADKVVKVWGYDEGYQYCEGTGHSGEVTKCKISPDQQSVVSVGKEGAIFIWVMPKLAPAEE